jgi:magnesium chelatase subunit D
MSADAPTSQSGWADAACAAAIFAVDPVGLGGVSLRSAPGPVRDGWLDLLRGHLAPGTPIRRVPLNIADDRLLGGLDLAATLSAGRPVAERGILAEADGGLIVLPMAERLSAGTAARLTAALDSGEVATERDGMAARNPARIGVVALDEGIEAAERPPAALLDRLGFWLDLGRITPVDAVGDAGGRDIATARAHLPDVVVPPEMIEALCGAALALGIYSLRPVLMALKVARIQAALSARSTVSSEDTNLAARLVYAPRATLVPEPAQPNDPPPPERSEDDAEPPDSPSDQDDTLTEMMIDAARAALPADLLAALAHGLPQKGSAQAGQAGVAKAAFQGRRPIGTRPGALVPGARLSVIETLRAAAGWQKLRRRIAGSDDGQPVEGRRIEVRRDDFRIQRREQRRSTVTIFVVDASGSSALNRLGEAKGAVELLLADCYVRRDQVALIAFRGREADLLLPPTRSLVRAKRGLASLPGGGATPLAAGLNAASTLAEAVQRRGQTPIIVLLTDGQPNIAQDGSPGRDAAGRDALTAGQGLRLRGIASLLVDTSRRPEPAARTLATAMNARYLPLPHADAAAISAAVRSV